MRRSFSFISHIINYLSTESSPGHSWRSTRDVPCLQVILNPGDEVIIHEPYFSPYKDQVLLADGVPVFYQPMKKMVSKLM